MWVDVFDVLDDEDDDDDDVHEPVADLDVRWGKSCCRGNLLKMLHAFVTMGEMVDPLAVVNVKHI